MSQRQARRMVPQRAECQSTGRARLRLAFLVPLSVACAVGLAGCTLPSISGLGPGREDAVVLGSVGLSAADAASGAEFGVIDGGDEVVGQVTLDLCRADFPSEAARRARHQVAIADEGKAAWVSTEAVLYEDAAAAQRAMSELSTAVSQCSSGGDSQGDGQAAALVAQDDQNLTWKFEPAPDGDWPSTAGIQRQAYQFQVSDPFGDSYAYQSTYLRRGRLLVAAYVTPPGSQAEVIAKSPSPARFIEVLSARMAALPNADVR